DIAKRDLEQLKLLADPDSEAGKELVARVVNKLVPLIKTIRNAVPQEITRVTELSVLPVNESTIASLDRRISELQSSLVSLSSRVANTSSLAQSSVRMVSLSQHIDNLDSIEIRNGASITSGGLDITEGNIVITTGNVTANGFVVRESITVNGTATSTLTTLSVTGQSTFGDDASDLVFFRAGTIHYNASATSTISNGAVNAWSLATSTDTRTPFLSVDSSNNRIGAGTVSPSAKLHVYGPAATTPVLRIQSSESGGDGFISAVGAWTNESTDSDGAHHITWGGYWNGSTNTWTRSYTGALPLVDLMLSTTGDFSIRTDPNTSGDPVWQTRFLVDENGNVGIGDATPDNLFDIDATGAANAFVVGANARVGVGTTTPGALLSVSAATSGPAFLLNQTSTGDLLTLQDSGTTRFIVKDGGAVGIGTDTPGVFNSSANVGGLEIAAANARLTLDGTTDAGIWFNDSGATSGERVWRQLVDGGSLSFSTASDIGGSISTRLSINNDGSTVIHGTSASNLNLNLQNSTSATGFLQYNGNDLRFFANSGSVSTLNITGGSPGNVGIGETSPGSKLSVSGNTTIGASYDTSAAPANGLLVEGATGHGTTTPGGFLSVSISTTSPAFLVNQTSTGDLLTLQDGGATVFTVKDGAVASVLNSTGLGVGTSSPSQRLSIQGNLLVSGSISFASTTATGTITASNFNASGSSATSTFLGGLTIATGGGNVGIGTTSPWARLSVNQNSQQPAFAIGSSTATSFLVSASGNVGLGSTTPLERLTLTGGSFFQAGGDSVTNYTPRELGGVEFGANVGDKRQPIFVAGNFAYVTVETASSAECSVSSEAGCEFRIYDISTSSPSFVGGADVGAALSVFVSGNIAYVGIFASTTNLLIYDIANPKIPTLLSSIVGGSVNSIHVAGRYLYVGTSGTSLFYVFDISNPRSPLQLSTISVI
ncbi:MAG: hypothetical protein HY460_00755, partial [Parcubacteria group bacterium]|nr:hypothetical protein [Parcubacteria group bacterium]